MTKVLVTGGAGYIGSHCSLALIDAGYDVVVLDNLSTGYKQLVPDEAELIIGDVADSELLDKIFSKHKIDAILHFAGFIVVSESVSNPLKYYDNNTAKTGSLVESAVKHKITDFIFSSTAAVYGEPEVIPVTEQSPVQPINPYGNSKLMSEIMLQDVAASGGNFSYGILRYFNVSGADAKFRSGQMCDDATHLIKVAAETALGKRQEMSIFGTDYPTDDGTCVRDYIHVSDLANAHLIVLKHLLDDNENIIVNAGYGNGFSVKEVISAVKNASGVDFKVIDSPRRDGDPSALISNSKKLMSLGWQPKFNDINVITKTAYLWEKSLMKS